MKFQTLETKSWSYKPQGEAILWEGLRGEELSSGWSWNHPPGHVGAPSWKQVPQSVKYPMTPPTHDRASTAQEATQNSQLGDNKDGYCFKPLGLNVIIYTAIDN